MEGLDLVNLIYTRISHDFSGAVGSIHNAVELFEEDSDFLIQNKAFLSQAAEILMTRLQFFRQTFGLKGVQTDDKTASYLKTLSAPFEMDGCCITPLQRSLCMMLGDILIKGGRIHILPDSITAEGTDFKDVALYKQILQDGKAPPEPLYAPAVYAVVQARREKKKLELSHRDKEIKIEIF